MDVSTLKKKIEITIPEPCHEQWQNMPVTRGGRHCASCARDVIDFTLLSDQQLISFLEKQAGNGSCGRFYADQLNRPLQPTDGSFAAGSLAHKMAAGLLFLHIAIGNSVAHAQKKVVRTAHSPSKERQPGTLTIRGTVVDAMTRQPVPGITVQCEYDDSVVSDAHGRFVIHLKQQFSSIDSVTLLVAEMSDGQGQESGYYFPPVKVKAGASARVVLCRYIQEQLPVAQIARPTVSSQRVIVMGGMPGSGYYAAAPAPKRNLWNRITSFFRPKKHTQ